MIKRSDNMRNAYVENILLWIVMFIGFVTFFFFVLDYSKVVRVKDNMDSFSDYGARMISLNGTGSLDDLVERLNAMKIAGISPISTANIACNAVSDMPPRYQVIFITQTSADTDIASFYSNQLVSRRAVFNETNSQTVTCTLTVKFTQ